MMKPHIRNLPNILTLEETARYLRLSQDIIEQQAKMGYIPGRRIEDQWRFLKTALDDWLRSQDGRAILLRQAGAFEDDQSLSELCREIYIQRGRPEVAPHSGAWIETCLHTSFAG